MRGYFADMRHVSRTGPGTATLSGNLEAIERDRLRKALDRVGWVKAKVARALGISLRRMACKIGNITYARKKQTRRKSDKFVWQVIVLLAV